MATTAADEKGIYHNSYSTARAYYYSNWLSLSEHVTSLDEIVYNFLVTRSEFLLYDYLWAIWLRGVQ